MLYLTFGGYRECSACSCGLHRNHIPVDCDCGLCGDDTTKDPD
jgi:hypothetical protein